MLLCAAACCCVILYAAAVGRCEGNDSSGQQSEDGATAVRIPWADGAGCGVLRHSDTLLVLDSITILR